MFDGAPVPPRNSVKSKESILQPPRAISFDIAGGTQDG